MKKNRHLGILSKRSGVYYVVLLIRDGEFALVIFQRVFHHVLYGILS